MESIIYISDAYYDICYYSRLGMYDIFVIYTQSRVAYPQNFGRIRFRVVKVGRIRGENRGSYREKLVVYHTEKSKIIKIMRFMQGIEQVSFILSTKELKSLRKDYPIMKIFLFTVLYVYI